MRLVAVLGYSGRRGDRIHAVCLARVRHAEGIEGDAVLLSGEAELMRGDWRGGDVLLDPDARNTRENARAVAAAARRLGADEGGVVTPARHAHPARPPAGAALRDPRGTVTSSSPAGRRPVRLLARELACIVVLPLHARELARRREPGD